MVDFSRFSPEVLQAIEKAARMANLCHSHVVTSCHLVGGLASVNGGEVCSVLQDYGFAPDQSMEAIAQGMSEEPAMTTAGDGISFHPEVEAVFAKASSQSSHPITIPYIMGVLLNSAPSLINHYLVKRSSPVVETISQAEVKSDNLHELGDTPTGNAIKQYCTNMLALAADGKLVHAIGRDEEVKRVLLILSRSTKNNPVLVGEPGTGKTAIAEELALRLYQGHVPANLARLKLYSLDFTSIKSQRDSVAVMKQILEEAKSDPLLVLFIDEIHMLVSTCNCSDNDITNLLKPAMARGEIKILGATTLDEYKRIEKDPAFERRFQKIIVDEPDIESAIKILQGAKGKYEAYHDVTISDEVCKVAVKMSARYITNRKLPDKAFDLIDEAAANVRIENNQIRSLQVNDVMKVITAWTGIPVGDMEANEMQRLQRIEQQLHASVVGQDRAVKVVADAIKRSRMGFSDASRPIGSFLFLGTTGTGKTELCKAIAKYLFDDPNQMVRLDMSEYQQEHSAYRLFGSPPGYVGYEQGGQLTEAIYRKPFSVVLFDEIEKAHPKIWETLLQVLDDGRMTDGKGKVVNFKNTIIVMTSNLGQQEILHHLCNHQASDEEVEACTRRIMRQLKLRVAPEFINRIDNIVMFRPLTKENLTKIAEINLHKEVQRLKERNITITIEPEVIDYVVGHGYQPEYGARPVKRVITDNIINPLTAEIIKGTVDRHTPICVSVSNDKISFSNGSTTRI